MKIATDTEERIGIAPCAKTILSRSMKIFCFSRVGGRLKRTKRFTIKSPRGKKKGEKRKEEMEGKRGKRGCGRILFVSRGEKRLIYKRVGNSRENHYLYFSMSVANFPLSENRPNKIRSTERMCPNVSVVVKRSNLFSSKNK